MEKPLLYHKTIEEIDEYRKKPLIYKLRWLAAQMEFFNKVMPEGAKDIRDKIKDGRI